LRSPERLHETPRTNHIDRTKYVQASFRSRRLGDATNRSLPRVNAPGVSRDTVGERSTSPQASPSDAFWLLELATLSVAPSFSSCSKWRGEGYSLYAIDCMSKRGSSNIVASSKQSKNASTWPDEGTCLLPHDDRRQATSYRFMCYGIGNENGDRGAADYIGPVVQSKIHARQTYKDGAVEQSKNSDPTPN
jgi:hypothetical protein